MYNKEELNEKILNGRFSRSFCLSYRNVEHWEMYKLYFWVSLANDFCQKLHFWVQLSKARTRPLPKLVSTDPLGLEVVVTKVGARRLLFLQ